MRRAVAFCLSFLLLFALMPTSHAEAPSADGAEAAVLFCQSTESLLFEKNADKPLPPGQLAQLMTALLTLEAYPDLTTEVTLSEGITKIEDDYRSPLDYGFKKGTTLPIGDLLAAMILENAACAALLLATVVSGSREAFVDAMNTRADELGMSNTLFKNASGEDAEGALTTAKDLLILVKHLYHNAAFMALASSAYYTLANNQFTVHTRNYMLGHWYTNEYLYSKADGMKAGFTTDSGYTLVATAVESDGFTYFAILLGGREIAFKNATYSIAKALFAHGAEDFSFRNILSSATLLKALPVKNAVGITSVSLFPKESLSAYLENDIPAGEIEVSYTLTKESIEAPFEKGTVVGEVIVTYRGKVIGKTDLVTGNGAIKTQGADLRSSLKQAIKPLLIILCLLVALILLRALYLFWQKQHPKEDD